MKSLTKDEIKNKLIRIYGRLNSPRKGVSKRAENVVYDKQQILDAIEELKELMVNEGLEFKKE